MSPDTRDWGNFRGTGLVRSTTDLGVRMYFWVLMGQVLSWGVCTFLGAPCIGRGFLSR